MRGQQKIYGWCVVVVVRRASWVGSWELSNHNPQQRKGVIQKLPSHFISEPSVNRKKGEGSYYNYLVILLVKGHKRETFID